MTARLETSPLTADSAAARLKDDLLRDGYLILPDAIERPTLDAFSADIDAVFAETPFCRGPFYGETTKRFGRVLLRSPHAPKFVCEPLVLAIVKEVLLDPFCNAILLSTSQAIEIHPGSPPQQPHRDQDIFGGEKGRFNYMVQVMWALDDFTSENGATRLWPGSNQADPHALRPDAEAIPAVAPRGSAIFYLGSTQHSGGANRSAARRRGVVFSYCQGWLRPFENPWLSYPPEIVRQFDDELQGLVGYRMHLPNLGNVEGQCPSVLLRGETVDHPQFVDPF